MHARLGALAGALLLASTAAAGAHDASPAPAAGGTFQRSSVEGCMNEFLFNGVWRVKVLAVDPNAEYNDGSLTHGTGVKVQVRNGTAKAIAPDETGFSDINGHGIDLAYSDENTANAVGAGTGLTANLLDKKLPPGGASTVTLYFPPPQDKAATPAKLLIAVDPKSSHNTAHVAYSIRNPSFRVHLDCTK